ncbi:putative riboflavin kinase [Lucilia cuprina]|uniref:riboflavin kinase n=1 Tax=Lucilia cuprina TaxID=7375 RepID=A0A0L0CKM9_LUCCU|nr:putative riboflavin kinase [Lucilia cuprina]KNC32792.1 putative riboflavin kinase [Lucilia cuprina]
MFAKSLQSIRRVSLSIALLNNVHNNLTRSCLKPTTIAISGYQRKFCHRTVWTLYCGLPEITLINKPFCIISRRVSSQLSSGSIKMLNYLPFFASGEIVAGFGRGSKELGIPTANYPLEVVKSLPDCFKPGVYFGWANIDNGPVYKMVMSIGWNPFYDNKEKSIETHILHEFNRDLYGCLLKVCIVGYLRPEQNFKSLEDLIACIKNDIAHAEDVLESNDVYKELQSHQFFLEHNHQNNDNHINNTSSKSNNNSA